MDDGKIKKETAKSEIAEKEEEILKFWQENKVFEQSVETPAGAEPKDDFVFYDGPPFATGTPHFGHLLPTSLKDAMPRYQTMKGKRVRRRFGWDCHGLPVENIVEQELNLKVKKDIEKYGLDRFNEAARESVLRYTHDWEKIIPRMGRFVDMADNYRTMDTEYTESVWWVFKTLYDRGLVYEGHKSMHICPRCETTLANFEVSQGYKEVTDFAVTVKFKIISDNPMWQNTSLLAWTTTSWTLPANSALAVNEKIKYGKYEIRNSKSKTNETTDSYFVILAKGQAAVILKNYDYQLVKDIIADELIGLTYEPPFNYYTKDIALDSKTSGWKVYAAGFVNTEEGTGIVHVAPAFGEDDMELGKKYDLPFIQPVGLAGRFKSAVKDFAGQAVKPKDKPQATDIEIIKYLAHHNLLLAKEKVTHSYPHCWRCDTPLLNYAATSWFVKVTVIKDKLLTANSQINWVPAHIKEGRFGKWLSGARDWAISRSRFWGAPLPVWRCRQCGQVEIIGSVKNLSAKLPPPANKYFIMRHGEAESNVRGIVSGLAENEHHLTDRGREEARLAAAKLKNEKIDLIFASPFIRTRETATLAAAALGLTVDKIIYDDRLKEIDSGRFNNRPVSEYRNFFQNTLEKFTKRPAGGETLTDVKKRVIDLLKQLEEKYSGRNILIISHEYPVWMLETGLQGWTDRQSAKIKDVKDDYINTGEEREIILEAIPRNRRFELDLHRPYIDAISFPCSCGGRFHRVPEVFDCWFESGAMPYGQAHYPFAGGSNFNPVTGHGFPADFIAEALDQTRGWFYSLLVLSVALFDLPAYKNVIVNGLVLAADGQKMSKRLKNYPDLELTINKYGADALRLYLLGSPAAAGEEFNFSEKDLAETYRRIILRLLNVQAFYDLYADSNLIGRMSSQVENTLDRWLLARLAETKNQITQAFDNYEINRAIKPLDDFIDDFSTWYIRRSRDRFKSDDQKTKQAALEITGLALGELSRLLAPLAPFTAEIIYQKLKLAGKKSSVHLESWPTPAAVDREIITDMAKIRSVVEAALSLRAAAGLKVRQPLKRLFVKDSSLAGQLDLLDLIKAEINVADIVFDDKLKRAFELDTEITAELKEAGQTRELIRQLQSLRKELNLKPTDKINLYLSAEPAGRSVMEKHADEIKKAAGAAAIIWTEAAGGQAVLIDDWEFNIKAEPVDG